MAPPAMMMESVTMTHSGANAPDFFKIIFHFTKCDASLYAAFHCLRSSASRSKCSVFQSLSSTSY